MNYKQPLLYIMMMVGVTSLTACTSTTPAPYQAERPPESRDAYYGAEGAVQYVKDQSFLLKKETRDKCEAAKMAYLEALSQNDHVQASAAEKQMSLTCV